MVVMYETSAEPVCTGNSRKTFSVKHFSHQTRQHEKAPEFHHILMECCIYENRMFLVAVWNEMCISVIFLCTESMRIVSCIGIKLCFFLNCFYFDGINPLFYNCRGLIPSGRNRREHHNEEDVIGMETDEVCEPRECEPEVSHILI
jgi:hypothetical protein